MADNDSDANGLDEICAVVSLTWIGTVVLEIPQVCSKISKEELQFSDAVSESQKMPVS